MRLVTIRPGADGESGAPDHRAPDYRVAVVMDDGHLVPLSALAQITPSLEANFGRMELAGIIARDPDFDKIREALGRANPKVLEAAALAPADVRVAAPIPRPGKIVGVGYNYLDHIREQGLERPIRPVLFSKFANAVTADGAPIRRPAGTHALDLEAELAVVIGRRASRVRPEDGLRHVAGYTAANDVTARDWQGQAKALRPGEKGDGQWLRAKGSDTFLPLGPVLVTADELADGRGLRVRSWRTAASQPVTGSDAVTPFQMQDGNTADLLFGVAELISIISREVTLDPGDVIVTGTPSGVGVFREPPVFLEPGDLVRVEVERIGTLTNPITDEEGNAPTDSPAARFMAARSVDMPFEPSFRRLR
ncbi:MAG: fumarylacetoacetate hydrolase family protein [Candidatus Limnocylindrales bacterium]|jgi:2-keto-4-pentenoate hydratase/2-oxohepta-3-ene-1,7-dioic acid hydratase in catechol pathway